MDKTLIIAEAGVNHNGDVEIAKKLVLAAKEAGADIIKFQTFRPDALTSKYAKMAEYQKENVGVEKSQREMLEELTLSDSDYVELKKYSETVGIRFLSTSFDIQSTKFLSDMGCDLWKIPSGEITNYPYLVDIAKKHQPIILSTGMCTEQDITDALQVLKENGAGEISLLHCTTEYPTPYTDVNLSAMSTMRLRYGLNVGYSDHTRGIEVPIAAVAMGAQIIEKHFTLDRNMEGPDHKASLEPDELKRMVTAIRNIETALGSGIKEPAECEKKNIAIARKSIVANRRIKKGELLTTENITTKRPGTGISPMRWNEVQGTYAVRDFEEDELIEL